MEKVPFCDVDAAILSQLSYTRLTGIVAEAFDGQSVTIREAGAKVLTEPERLKQSEDDDLWKLAMESARFQDLILAGHIDHFDIETEKQFSAITVLLPEGKAAVVYRGTDLTIVGWKEDFNMSFMKDIPSQKEALKYLQEIGKKYFGKIILGGHSKGGNIAIYAATYCEDKIKRKILEIINADGPGFDETIITSENYLKISERINTYIPQASIIGRLLEHEDDYEIVYSTQKGLMQHDIFSWEVDGNNLKRIENLTLNSQFVNKVVRDWLKNTTSQQRENFVNIIYEVLISTDAKDVNDFSVDTLKKISVAIKSYKSIEKEERKEIEYMIKLVFESIISIIKLETKDKVNKKIN